MAKTAKAKTKKKTNTKSQDSKEPARITRAIYTGAAQAKSNLESMIQWAMENNKPMEYINAIWEQRREEITKVERSAFNRAKSIFQRNLPDLRRNAHANSSSSDYWFLDLDEMIKIIKEPLADAGFTYDWDHEIKQAEIIVTCILSHVDGHSKSTQLRHAADDSNNLKGIQAMGSTISYLRRYTLSGILGISSGAKDDDGKKSKPAKGITEATDKEYADTLTAIKKGKLNLEDAEKNRTYTDIQRIELMRAQNDRDFNQSKP